MKKYIFVLIALLSISFLSAQVDLQGPAENINNSIKQAFPYVVGAIFLVFIFFNLGDFVGDSQNIKKGIGKIILFLVIVGAVAGIYSYITSINLS